MDVILAILGIALVIGGLWLALKYIVSPWAVDSLSKKDRGHAERWSVKDRP